ncbi:MAG: phage holin family protein, partial [Oscillospiraceae bacterium]|nr:phage holin family protein [Oscillospiraceae bacterium]
CISFMVNELISIIENAGILGIPIPDTVKNTIELLKNKGENKHD